MPINYKTNVAVLEGVCGIEEGDALLEWLIANPKGKINLKQTSHLHTALLQILLCHQPKVSVAPENAEFKAFWQATVRPLMESNA